MVELSRYNVSDDQAGLDQGIFKNKLGLTKEKDLQDTETILQIDSYKYFFDLSNTVQLVFSVKLLLEMHKYFFGTLYTWAGTIRTVDISKGEMLFATVRYISAALEQLDKVIQNNTPVFSDNTLVIAEKLTLIHNEFNVIHPFRDGNGRTIRLFLDVLVHTLGYDQINYESRETYLTACVAGALNNNEPMQKIIAAGLNKTIINE